jgi:hypothetical protein
MSNIPETAEATPVVPTFAQLSDEPHNLWEYLWYIQAYAADIFVREQIEGKWDSVALASLPPDRWAYHVSNWLGNNIVPARMRRGVAP